MADGTLIFDTELNPDGLNKGLEELSKNSGESAKKVSASVLKSLDETVKTAAASAKANANQMVQDAVAAEKTYHAETENIHKEKIAALEHYLSCELSNFEKSKALREEELGVIERAYELGIISTDEYFVSLAAFRDKYFSESSEGWLQYTLNVIAENKRLTDEQKKALTNVAEDMSDNVKEMFDSIIKERDKLEEKLNSYGSIKATHTFDFGDSKQEFTMLADIEAQNKRLEKYFDLMVKAQKRINSYWRTDTGDLALDNKNLELRNEYFSQMRDMSVDDATDFASLIVNANDKEFTSHLAGFERRQYLAEEISNVLFCEETKGAADSAARNLGKDFSGALLDELEGLDGEFFIKGQNACQSFGDGFMSSLDSVLEALSQKIVSGTALIGHGDISSLGTQNVENNTSYNIYSDGSPEETIRLIKEQEELKRMLGE